jgi:hypothetical protein
MAQPLSGFTPADGKAMPVSGFTPISRESSGFKPIMPTFVPDTDPRVQKYGGIKAEPEKSWLSRVGDVAKHLVPYHQYMSEEGRKLTAAMPEEAQAQQNFMEFTKALDWMVGGPNAISFFGRRALKNVEASTAREVLGNLTKTQEKKASQLQTKNQKHIDELFDDLTHPKDLTAAQQNQKIIEQTFADNTKTVLPIKQFQPADRIAALEKANQKIINAEDFSVAQRRMDVGVSQKAQEGTSELLGLAKRQITQKAEPVTETTKLLRAASRSQRRQPWAKTAEDMLDDKDIMYFHSGFPLKQGVKDTLQLFKDVNDRIYWKPPSPKDLSVREQIIGIPQWLAKKYPQVKKLYNIEMARGDARLELQRTFHEGLEDFFRLKGDDYETVKRVLLLGDKEGRVFTDSELAKAGVSGAGIRAYNGVRNTLDDVQRFYWKKMKDAGVPDDEILALRKQIGSITGYFPRTRYGKHFIKAEKAGEPTRRIHFNSGVKGAQIKKQLEEEGFKIVDSGNVTKLPEEVYFQISPEAISQVTDYASKDMSLAIRKELKQNIANAFKERGWGQHGISRKDYVEGFETENLKKVLFDYVNGFSGYMTKMDAAQQFKKELMGMAFDQSKSGISAAELPRLYKWTENYVKDVMSNADMIDKVSAGIRAASFHKYLGAVVKTGFVNLSQNAVAAAPRLSLETKWAYAKLGKAMGDIVAHYAPKGRVLAAEEQKALRIALQKRWGHEQYIQELMGNLNRFGPVPGAVQKIMGGPMAISERFNRQSTFLAAFRVFRKEKKMAFDDAVKAAGEVVADSQFTYGKSNLPSVFRGTTVGKLARSGYTFRTFPHHFINLLSYLNKKDKKAVAKSLASLVAIGGASAIPLAKTIEAIAQRFGHNPRQHMSEKLSEYGLDFMEDTLTYGLPALLDIDLSGSIGMELPGQHQMSSAEPRAMLLEGATDVLGVPFSYVDDTIKAGQRLYNGDVYRAIEDSPVTPVVVSNAMQAKRIATEGRTTMGGEAVLDDEGEPVKFTTGQAIKKGVFGFQPVESSKQYQKYRSREAMKTFWNNQGKRLLASYRNAANRHGLGSKEADKVIEKILHYQENVPPYATPITTDSLMETLMDKVQPKEMLLREMVK